MLHYPSSAQRIKFVDRLMWEVGVCAKSSNLKLEDLNNNLATLNFLPFDDNTQEIDFHLNINFDGYPLGVFLSTSYGGSSNVALDKSQYSNISVSHYSIGVFHEFILKRFSARGFVTFEKANYRADFYNRISPGSLSSQVGSTIKNFAVGTKPGAQILINIGKRRRNSLGVEYSYFFRINQSGWQFYPSGPAYLPDMEKGEQAFALVYFYRFYDSQ